jgi:ATP-binding cassette subfamily F protein 3
VANTIWEIDNHKIKTFDGGYEEWNEWKERMAASQKSDGKGQKPDAGSQKSDTGSKKSDAGSQKPEQPQTSEFKPQTSSQPSAPKPINKELKKELQKQQRIFQQLEETIGQLNKQKADLEARLTAPETYADREKFMKTEADYKKVSDELQRQNKQYEEVFEKIMELEAKQ